MINLITGLPGNGKTLYTLSYVNEMSIKDNRPVFYHGITDLKLPWTEIDPEKWFDCPAGSIIVIDECQKIFRPRTISKEVPEYVSRLETHRHEGFDIFLITQHPMLADTSIRRLAGCHKHVVRTFGTQFATVHEWGSVKDNCDKTAGRTDSVKHKWKFDKKAFDFYKSAEIHTVKRNIPARLWILLLAPFLIGGAVFYMYKFTEKQTKGVQTSSGVQTSLGQNVLPQSLPKLAYQNALEDSKNYIYNNTARIEGLPQTAPKYDELTKPSVVPVPAGCVASKSSCGCWTQQATPIRMSEQMCRDIVKNGYFQDFENVAQSRQDLKEEKSSGLQNVKSDYHNPVSSFSDSATVAKTKLKT
jgi:zona occludens toxin